MIQQQSIDEVLGLNILDVIGKYVALKPKGIHHVGTCPFHQEKTPSFSVSASKGIFKCFGCGKYGNAIGFVMELKKLDFIPAVKAIAADHNITLLQEASSPEANLSYQKKEQLYAVNRFALSWFRENLGQVENSIALAYLKSRWNDESISEFALGFAPDQWDGLKKQAQANGFSEEILLEAGLLSESKGKRFDYFRGRVIFPILSAQGRVTGFTGRDLSGQADVPKYFNTKQTEIFSKGKNLYGLNLAARSIKEKGFAFLVEGNGDVIRLHQIGKPNTVGSGGTALTTEQIGELKSRCTSVTLIGDSDPAGKAATLKNGKLIIRQGLFCNVVCLPDEDGKQDPDSFFTDEAQFDQFVKTNSKDFIFWLAETAQASCKNPEGRFRVMEDLTYLITRLPANSHDLYIEQLSKHIRPKKAWQDKIKSIMEDEHPQEKTESFQIPRHVILSDFEKYGFYEDDNCYYFRTKSGMVRGSNFIMAPLFHIASILNSKRIFKITNQYGYSQVIEFLQKDLISLSNFRLRVESLGNFIFEGTEVELNRLKRYLYEKTDSCHEIAQLGWHKEGFWAWSNGIFNSTFTASDQNGIVGHEGRNYYLPSSSDIYVEEENLYLSERRFKFIGGNIPLYEYADRLLTVYGDNAIFGLCFYFASLFRDHIFKHFNFFPLLNLFGPKGAGKTEMAISLMQFFGNQAKGPNISSTSKAALADHVALFSNSLCHIDEYKNNLETEKIEFLKGLWDGTGRTRMNMDKDKKKETTAVEVGLIISGQEMTTADIALFSRVIYLFFSKCEFTEAEKDAFNDLKAIEKHGITHITHQLLSHRKLFVGSFMENYHLASKELTESIHVSHIEDRIFRNWLIILASYRTLSGVVNLPWDYTHALQLAAQKIVLQNREIKTSNELSVFWSIVEFLTNDGLIKEEVDFKIDIVNKLKTDLVSPETLWPNPKKILILNHSRIFQLYRVHGQKSKENILPLKTLEYYLVNSPEYLGKKHAVAFRVENYNRIVEDQDSGVAMDGTQIKKTTRRITTAMIFDYEMLNISIMNVSVDQKVEESTGQVSEVYPF